MSPTGYYGEIADGLSVQLSRTFEAIKDGKTITVEASTTNAIRDAHERLGRAKAQMTERCTTRRLVLVAVQEPKGDITSFRLSITHQSGRAMSVVGRTELEALDLLADKLNREAWL